MPPLKFFTVNYNEVTQCYNLHNLHSADNTGQQNLTFFWHAGENI